VIQKWPFIRVGRYGHFQTFWTQSVLGSHTRVALRVYMARQLYKNICMLFLFPVKDGNLVQSSMQHLMHHVTVSLQQSKITLQNNCIKNTSITQPTLSFYL